ncbi:maleylpyruvate isomerase family mycothiol-dependent enzyme [Streptomyces sp. KLOTTS4A1]|uniref:maleylpyruvate isomerase family mycothiol-dependent enzyme n=1 Tax=Streptomyces sp. KLOTTS4A1 TaxID=3390996 RepID=UPI0039F4D9F2
MESVARFDAGVEHTRTRTALAVVIERVAGMVKAAPDPGVASGLPGWSVGDVGAHLAAVYLACGSVFGEEAVPWGEVMPQGEGSSFGERIAQLNAASVQLIGPEERAGLADVLARRGERFLAATEGLAPDTEVPIPWYGPDVTLTLGALTGVVLSESLVHGLDFARGAGVPWTVEPDHARLVLGQMMPTMMALTTDREKARGVRIAFDLAVKGGPRLAVLVEGGELTVVRDAPPRRYDCRITVDPVTFLLVSFERMPVWKAVVSGRMRAGGRRPWLAPRLSQLVGGV